MSGKAMSAPEAEHRKLTIPQVQDRLLDMADRLESKDHHLSRTDLAKEIRYLVDQLYRRKAKKRARIEHRMTDEKRQMVWELHRAYPDASWQAIGSLVDLNTGRVSEIITGKREDA